ncbi:YhdP family protein [Phaeobacter marinintestinus]|uniref:YhdP family protein n=1 Tax=Falsiphaeobacter marinintestinus TaxID=1492905 RepID=UPI001644B96E|nr:DUF3971 domain-containing protein [Phaeobacter marinintestinus]
MDDGAPVTDQDKGQPAPKPRRKRRVLKTASILLFAAVVLLIMAGAAALSLIGQRLHAPDWLRSELETRIERNLGSAQIDFGEVEFIVNKGWRPRLRLRNVVLSDGQGSRIVELSHAEASLAMRPLIRGKIRPKRILISGVFATLRRDQGGAVSLLVGDRAAPVGQAAGLPQLIESWDKVLLMPALEALVAVEMDTLTMRYEDARQGRGWTLDGGLITLDRDGDDLRLASSFALLSGRDYASLFEANYSSRIGDTSADFGVVVTDVPAADIAAQNPVMGWLGVLRAPISGALRGSVADDGALGPVSATLQIGAGAVQPTDQSRPIRFNQARTYLTYIPGSQVLKFDELSVDSDWVSGVSEGRAFLSGVENGKLTELVGQFKATSLRVNPDGLLPEPLVPEAASFDFRLELDPFRLTLGEAAITDRAGQIGLSGDLTADQNGWHLALDGQMDQLTPKRLLESWPEQAAPKPRKWVSENLFGGNLSDIDFAVRLEPGQRPFFAVDWSFSEARVRFNKHQPPITGGAGQVSILGDRLMVTATEGVVTADQGGDLNVAGTSFMIPDMSVKPFTYGIIRARAQGPVTAALSLLNRPPLAVLKDTPLPVDMADGQVAFEGTMSVPLRPKVPLGEIEFHLDGTLTDVASAVLIPGQSLTADTLRLQADQSQVVVSGDGVIGALPATFNWRQPLGADSKGKGSRVNGTVELSQRTIDTFAIGLPKGSVGGEGVAQVVLELKPKTKPALTITSDLKGVALAIPSLGWRKPPGSSGRLDLSVTLGESPRVDALSLDAAGLKVSGSVSTRADGGLDRAVLNKVSLGGWLDASLLLTGRGDAQPAITVQSGSVDLGKRPRSSGSGGDGSGPVNVSLSRLRISETLALTDFKAALTSSGGTLAGPFSGQLNGQTALTGRIVPQSGGSAIEVASTDGGGVFRSAGILNQAHGGPFTLKLIPAGPAGHYTGSLRVTNTRIKDAPVMAAMMNAVSVVGLLDEMAGQGILFTEVDAKFQLTPEKLIIQSSSAVGPSIGLSMDGSYDLRSKRLGMRGVFSPVYLLNAIGSVLTRKGEGIIGFNYTLTGLASDPNLQVNPLSGLAPGMFREIFRGESAPDPDRDIPATNPSTALPHNPMNGAGDR